MRACFRKLGKVISVEEIYRFVILTVQSVFSKWRTEVRNDHFSYVLSCEKPAWNWGTALWFSFSGTEAPPSGESQYFPMAYRSRADPICLLVKGCIWIFIALRYCQFLYYNKMKSLNKCIYIVNNSLRNYYSYRVTIATIVSHINANKPDSWTRSSQSDSFGSKI